MFRILRSGILVVLLLALGQPKAWSQFSPKPRQRTNFDSDWRFHLGDQPGARNPVFADSNWKLLDLPHDWSIDGPFDPNDPATVAGGALPGGIGWYRKTFYLDPSDKGCLYFIDFDGVYMNSQVWINGHYLGIRPYGYSSFEYELSPYLHFGRQRNRISVRVDNSKQPNSRWYSGSGIYRNVWLVRTNPIHIAHWGTYVHTPEVSSQQATVVVQTRLVNSAVRSATVDLETILLDPEGRNIARFLSRKVLAGDGTGSLTQTLRVPRPQLWSLDHPQLYQVLTRITENGITQDSYRTPFGIRFFRFDPAGGFFLNGVSMKIKGVCDHHDLGCLGAAVNTDALKRQLTLLRAMGCNAIRTSHNPPAPELLDLCDRMGFIVMDEAFDCWKKGKNPYDYHLYWDQWHARDLSDMIRRDRNHASVFIWSIGNEIPDQWDSQGTSIARELAGIVHSLDTTRPITSACNDPQPDNSIIRSGALDLIGYNYHQQSFPDFPKVFPNKAFIATETTSALESRGEYLMPSDSIRRWPLPQQSTGHMNPDFTCSAYDNISAPWGSTHEETWKIVKKYPFLSGMFIWTGFDYLGEPTPYGWPARSSYFGIIDLAGFPKDVYYMYQSEWTRDTVLHLFPTWNWKRGDSVDIWAYYNHADQVRLYLNGRFLGARSKQGDQLHVWWRVAYEPGTLKAVSLRGNKVIRVAEVRTAGAPARIQLLADRTKLKAGGRSLAFVTVRILDSKGILVPHADNLIRFHVLGSGTLAGVDNGSETDHESFQQPRHRAFNGLCLVVLRSGKKPGPLTLQASGAGLQTAKLQFQTGISPNQTR